MHAILVILGIGAAVILSITIAGAWGGLRLNMTRSYPLELWRIEALQRQPELGDIVFICPSTGGAIGNGWWPEGTNIIAVQRASAEAWARLFEIPLVVAFNR